MRPVGSGRPQGRAAGHRCRQGMDVRRSAVVVLIALVGAIVSVSPAAASIPRGRFGVGDSIMLSAADELATYAVPVDAVVGRRFWEGIPVVRRLVSEGTLPRDVIVHLGTNGWVTAEDCDRLVASAPGRRIFLTSIKVPREWQKQNNLVLNDCAARYERVFVIRWFRYSKDHPEWFSTDGYHLNVTGQAVYAAYLDAEVDAALVALKAGG